MRLKPAVLVAVLALAAFSAAAQSDSEALDSEAAVAFTGNVQRMASGEGTTDSATTSGGFLMNFRHRFHIIRLPFNGMVEANLTFTTFTQYYNPGGSQTQANIYEASGAYVIPFKVSSPGRWKPFVEGGGGYMQFGPVNSGSVQGAQKDHRPAVLYGGGVDWRKYNHLAIRLGYRGLVYRTPDFSLPQQVTGTWTHMAEPYVGFVYRF
jgi:opacity protein-like surface antigen